MYRQNNALSGNPGEHYLWENGFKFCLAYHTYFEPLENAKRAAQESGKPVLMPPMGEVVYLE